MEESLTEEEIREKALLGQIVLVSPAGMIQMQERINRIRAEHDEVLRQMGVSVSVDPDIRENPEFLELRIRAQHMIPSAFKEALDMKRKAIKYTEEQDGIIRFGTVFTAQITYQDGEMETQVMKLVGPIEASLGQQNGILPVSYLSPIGKALWGQNPHNELSYMVNGTPIYVQVEIVEENG